MSKWGIGFEALGLGRPVPPPVNEPIPPKSPPDNSPGSTPAKPRKVLKWIAIGVGGSVLLLAVLLVAFRIALSRAPEYRAQVQAWVSERTGLDIQFTRMDARWRFYGPELVFDSAVVRSRDGKRTLVSAERVSLGFDVWTAISTFRLAAGRLTLEHPELQVIRTLDGRIEVVGQSDLPERDPSIPFEPDAIPTGRLQVIGARLSFRDLKTGLGPWIVPGVNFDFKRRGRSMHLEGEAELPAKLGKSLQFVADTEGRLAAADELQWGFKIDAQELDLAGWAEFSPKDWPAPAAGRGSFTLSGVFTGIDVSDLSANVQLQDIAMTLPAWRIPVPGPVTLEAYVSDDDELQPDPTVPVVQSAVDTQVPNQNTDDGSLNTQNKQAVVAPQNIVARKQEHYERIGFDLHLTHVRNAKGETWNARIKDLELTRPKIPWRPSAVLVTVTRPTDGGIDVKTQADLLVLENLWPLLAYAPESQAMGLVRALRAVGSISEVQANYARGLDGAPTYSLRARISGLGTQAIAKAPGLTNFSGLIEGTNESGRLELNVRNGALDLPRFFRTPLPAERIAGILQWQHDAAGWHITTDELLIDSADGHARASGEVLIPAAGGSPLVDVKAHGWDLVAHAAPRYMPASKLSVKSLAWLDRAFVSGSVPKADFEMRGPVRAFPFRKDEGLFLITARVDDLTLDYQPGFIPAENLVVDAEFRNAGMTATLVQGQVNSLPILTAKGRIADFKQTELELTATVQGELSSALGYVQQSPIGPMIGEQFMALNAAGGMHAQVNMHLPLKDMDRPEIPNRKVSIDTRISNATVGTKALAQTVEALNGTLKVRDYALSSVDLRGRFLGGPVAIKGGVDGRYTGRGAGLAISAQGRAQGVELAKLVHLPASIPLGGAMQWQFSAHAPRHAPGEPAQPTYRINSDTKGLRVDVPAPLGKDADTVRNLQFEVDATRENSMLLRGAFGEARALLRMHKNDTGWSLDRGGVRVDAVAASLPAHPGLRIEGKIERFVLDDWLKLKADQPGKHRLADYLRAATVRIDDFSFLGFSWPSVRAILQATDHSWRVDVAGDDIVGQLTIPYELGGGAALKIALNKLNVRVPENSASASDKPNQTDPRDIPAIEGRVDEFSLSGRRVGVARFALDKVTQGVKLASGEIRGDSFTATARGSWLANPNGSISSLVLDVASTDVRDTLRAFNFRDLITGSSANAHAQLTWPGGLDEELLGRASGKVQIEVLDGQLLNVEPGGAGRMLGLLSIAALPRRLSLDFSDVTDKGISFDKVHADFELNDGDAYTNNLFLSGPQAEVGIVGRTGLGKHDYDLTAVGAGDIGGSLTVAGTVMGGPVLGAAVLAFTRLFKQPLKGVTRRYYHIGGHWENPIIEPIDKQAAKQDTAEADAAVSETQKENAEANSSAAATLPPSPPATAADTERK